MIKRPRDILDDVKSYIARFNALSPLISSFGLFVSIASLLTVHLYGYLMVLPDSLRALVDVEAMAPVLFNVSGALILSLLVSYVTFPVVLVMYMGGRRLRVLKKIQAIIERKAMEVFPSTAPSIFLKSLRFLIQYSVFLIIYLGLERGGYALVFSLLTLILALLSVVTISFAEVVLDGRDLPREDYPAFMMAAFPGIVILAALVMSFGLGVYRSYHVIEMGSESRLDLRERSIERVVFLSVSQGVIVHVTRYGEFPKILGVVDDKIDNFEFFPFSEIEKIEAVRHPGQR